MGNFVGHHSEDEQGRLHDELPYGWERVDDPHYGTYYIDHVNKRTQFEHPNPPPSHSQVSFFPVCSKWLPETWN